MGYELDATNWPILHFKFAGRLDQAEADRYFADGTALVTGGKPYVCVMDGTDMLTPQVEFVRRQAKWMDEHRVNMQQVNLGVAFILPSALIRGLVRAIVHYQDLPVPHVSFPDSASAWQWAERRASSINNRSPSGKRA